MLRPLPINDSVMLEYPEKIILAFGETFAGNTDLFNWLLQNGYPELAALSNSMRGNQDATQWLMKNGYQHLAAFDLAVDGKKDAYEWLVKYQYDFLAIFADACQKKPDAIQWFRQNNLEIFIRLSDKINHFRENQTFSIYKKRF